MTNERNVELSKAGPIELPKIFARVRIICKKLVIAQIETETLPYLRSFSAELCSAPSLSRSKNAYARRIPTNAKAEKMRRDLFTVANVLTNEFVAVRFSDSKFIARYRSFLRNERAQV